jgi:hypothetical protein
MNIRVHNEKEAQALVKEWNRSGQNAGEEEISFFKHESEEYVGRVEWADGIQEFIWQPK